MVDMETGLVALGAGIGGKDIIVKLLGPTADYIGVGFKDFTEKRVKNVKTIFDNANKKLGEDINNEGQVPPIVLKGIFEEGSWNDNELASEYFGGVLASSRSGVSRDDRGAYFNKIISSLSTYQLRSHYLFYNYFKLLFNGKDLSFSHSKGREKMTVFISIKNIFKNFDLSQDEIEQFPSIFIHVITGLVNAGLIDNYYHFGPIDHLKGHFKDVKEEGILIRPSDLGVTLYLWVHGKGQISREKYLEKEFKLSIDDFSIDYEGIEIVHK